MILMRKISNMIKHVKVYLRKITISFCFTLQRKTVSIVILNNKVMIYMLYIAFHDKYPSSSINVLFWQM